MPHYGRLRVPSIRELCVTRPRVTTTISASSPSAILGRASRGACSKPRRWPRAGSIRRRPATWRLEASCSSSTDVRPDPGHCPDFKSVESTRRANIAAGIAHDEYLWTLFRAIHSDREHYRFMMGAYNAGEGTIQRAQRVARDADLDASSWSVLASSRPKYPGGATTRPWVRRPYRRLLSPPECARPRARDRARPRSPLRDTAGVCARERSGTEKRKGQEAASQSAVAPMQIAAGQSIETALACTRWGRPRPGP